MSALRQRLGFRHQFADLIQSLAQPLRPGGEVGERTFQFRAQVVAGIAWSGVSRLGTVSAQFVIAAILARLLSPEDFGLIGMVAVFIGFANELLACAQRAVGLAKRVLDAAAKPALSVTLEQEVAAQETLAASDDFAEGARAFFEKRNPQFAGH